MRYAKHSEIELEELIILIKEYMGKHNFKFPNSGDFKAINNLPSYKGYLSMLKKFNIKRTEIYEIVGSNKKVYPNEYTYDEWVERYISIANIEQSPLGYHDVSKKFNLPTAQWFVENSKNPLIVDYNTFIKYEIGMCPNYDVDKETAIKYILEMSNALKRPLMYDDFKGNKAKIKIGVINKIWGTMNKMKEELGLEIVQEDMISKQKSSENMLIDLQLLIDKLGKLPTMDEIDECEFCLSSGSYHRYFGGINNIFIKLGYIPNKKCISLHLSNDEIIQMYKEFIEEKGLTPSHYVASQTYSLPAPITVIRRFNLTWNEFITKLGYKPNDSIINIHYAKDGSLCFSSGECAIHNYLLALTKITELEKETMYKDILHNDNLIAEAGRRRCDWTFTYDNKKYIVEYFGMIGRGNYKKRHDFKLDLIKRDGQEENFIKLYPSKLRKLDEVFSFIK